MKDEKEAPKLRFKGFTDDWEQCKLGDVADRFDNLRVPVIANLRKNGDTPYYGANGIQDYVDGYTHDGEYILVAEDGANNLKNYPINYVSGRIWVNNHAHVLQAIPYLASTRFLGYEIGRSNIVSLLVGGGRAKLNADALMNMNLNLPKIKEQELIADLFQKVEISITLHEEKKRQLERLKSALLQKMFADKSGYPAVRFKGFDDIWDQEKLNSLVRLHRGLTYSPNNVQDSGIRILRSSNILDGQFVMTDDDIFVKSSVVNIPTVKDGDILITAANGSIKLVGKHAIISGISENTAVSGGFMLVGSSRIPDFVNSLFDTSWYQRFIRKYVTGGNGSIGNLKKNDLDKQYVKVPTTSEQERIGEFFREIDQLIINNQIKHEKLLELKKFLLQNMFI